MMRLKLLHLIGGAPLTGKTTLGRELASSTGSVLVSTDSVRTWMQRLCSPLDFPHLFSSAGITVEQYYQKYPTAQDALEEEIVQCQDVAKGVLELLSAGMTWPRVVVEGIAVTPLFVRQLRAKYPSLNIQTTFLYDNDTDRIKRRIYSRGLWDSAHTYTDAFKPIEVEWTILYNQWFKDQVEREGLQVTPVKDKVKP